MIQTVVKIVFYTLIWSNYWNIPIHMTLVVKNPPANSGDIRDTSSIPGMGRFPPGGHSIPPQYSCLENSLDRAAWWFSPQGHTQLDTTPQLNSNKGPNTTRLHLP